MRQLAAVGYTDLIKMLEIKCKGVCRRIAILRFPLDGAIQHLLKLRRDAGFGNARWQRVIDQPAFITASGEGPVKGVLPESIS